MDLQLVANSQKVEKRKKALTAPGCTASQGVSQKRGAQLLSCDVG